MFNFIGSILAKTGAVIGGIFISIGAFFGGTPPAQEIVPTAPAEEAIIATTTRTTETSVSENMKTSASKNTEVIPVSVANNNNQALLIEKCKAENSKWLAAWPALEQSIRDKVRSDYQSAVWSYMQQYKGTITAGDIASSTSSSELRQEQQAVSVAKTKFDLTGSEAYQKCLAAIHN